MKFKTAIFFLCGIVCAAQSMPRQDMSKMDMSSMDMGQMDMNETPHEASGQVSTLPHRPWP